MKTVLVTGGAGYIGSHACKALALAGYLPVTFDNLVFGHREAVRWGPLVEGDLLDRDALDQAMRQYKPAAVMHFAAFAYVGESVVDPGKYYRNNIVGTLNVLQAMQRHSILHLVFSSSCAVYGTPEQVPITEDHPCRPINPYGATKWMSERMLADFGVAHGLRSISLRYFNAAGADPTGEIGEAHDPETHLVPLVLQAAAGKLREVVIHGTSHDTPDGTCIRDFVHVSDIAEAHVLSLRALQSNAASNVYNLGNGRGFSVQEVIDVARRVTGRDIVALAGPARQGDPACLVGDASRIGRDLDWHPRYPDLPKIIESAWRWSLQQAARDA
jgi:UDP-arabinose 4-epimerase